MARKVFIVTPFERVEFRVRYSATLRWIQEQLLRGVCGEVDGKEVTHVARRRGRKKG